MSFSLELITGATPGPFASMKKMSILMATNYLSLDNLKLNNPRVAKNGVIFQPQ